MEIREIVTLFCRLGTVKISELCQESATGKPKTCRTKATNFNNERT